MQTRQPSLEGTGEVRLRRLIKEALRMRPSRIIVGEVRQEECLDLLIALNSGVPGMATLHANSAREAVTKMCTLPLLAGENVTSAFVVPTVAACIDLVVYIRAERDGARRIHEIIGVPGRVEDGIIETAEIFVRKDGPLVRANGYPPQPERFAAAGFDLGELLHADQPAGGESAAAYSPPRAGRHSTRAAYFATDVRRRSFATGINHGPLSGAAGHPSRADERSCRPAGIDKHGWS
jgi:hypothetical protein